MSIGNLAILLSANSAQFASDLKRASGLVDGFNGHVEREFEKTGDAFAKSLNKMSPANLSRTAAWNIASAKLHKDYHKALSRETLAQGGGRFGALGAKTGLGPLVKMGAGLDMATAAIAPFATTIGIIAAVGAGAAAAVAGVAYGMLELGKASASAGLLDRYAETWDDLMAVIGRPFVPLLEMANEELRAFADALVPLLPTQAEMSAAFREWRPLIKEVSDVILELVPILKDEFINAMHLACETMKKLVPAFRSLWRVMAIGLKMVSLGSFDINAMGAELDAASERRREMGPGNSYGFSRRTAAFKSADQYAKDLYTAAYGENTPQSRTAKAAEAIQSLITRLHDESLSDETRQKALGDMIMGRWME